MRISFRTVARRAIEALVCGALCVGWSSAAFAQDIKSAALAKELASLMTAAKLDAIALQDPDAPDRFVAAMLFPDVQLLVVSARHPSPDYIKWQIGEKQYKEVYAALQQSGVTEGRLFVQDLGVNGLPPPGNDSVDVLYHNGVQTVFAGSGRERDYEKKLREADAQYSRLLQLAIDAVRQAPPQTGAG